MYSLPKIELKKKFIKIILEKLLQSKPVKFYANSMAYFEDILQCLEEKAEEQYKST